MCMLEEGKTYSVAKERGAGRSKRTPGELIGRNYMPAIFRSQLI